MSVAFLMIWHYGGGSRAIPSRKENTVKLIFKKGYLKILLWRRKREYSLFFWLKGAESLPHDHDVDERTWILWTSGFGISEQRQAKKTNIYHTIFYPRWTTFKVPAETRHVVRAQHFAITFNACSGPLNMNILDDFNPPDKPR